MAWARLDDGFFTNPKVLGLSLPAKLFHIAAITYCARELTDGRIPPTAGQLISGMAGTRQHQALMDELHRAGLWEECDGAYRIHDYLEFNPSREKVLKERSAARERMAKRTPKQGRNHADVRPNFVRSAADVRLPPAPAPTRGSKEPLAPNGAAREAPPDGAVALPKPNRVAEVVDLVKANGIPIAVSDRDAKAVRTCSATAAEIAEAYIAAYEGRWDPGGTGWLRGNLALHAVTPRLAGYQASKFKRPATSGTTGARPAARVSNQTAAWAERMKARAS